MNGDSPARGDGESPFIRSGPTLGGRPGALRTAPRPAMNGDSLASCASPVPMFGDEGARRRRSPGPTAAASATPAPAARRPAPPAGDDARPRRHSAAEGVAVRRCLRPGADDLRRVDADRARPPGVLGSVGPPAPPAARADGERPRNGWRWLRAGCASRSREPRSTRSTRPRRRVRMSERPRAYAWTRKQGGIGPRPRDARRQPARARRASGGRRHGRLLRPPHRVALVGRRRRDRRRPARGLESGQPASTTHRATASARSGSPGRPYEPRPVRFAEDLSCVDWLRLHRRGDAREQREPPARCAAATASRSAPSRARSRAAPSWPRGLSG